MSIYDNLNSDITLKKLLSDRKIIIYFLYFEICLILKNIKLIIK